MLTSTQIREIAKQTGILPYYQEKDYLQNIFLFNLYKGKEGKRFVFKGGTCLKLAYNYSRFSEDLDFNSNLSSRKIKTVVRKTLKSFELLGIKFELIKEEFVEDAYTVKIRFFGPMFSRKIESANAIQLDVEKRDRVVMKPRWVQINSLYPEIPKFFVFAMSEREILAEKFRALVMRAKARDLFDLWSMINANVKIEKNLIEKKLREKKLTHERVKFCSKAEYERDLKNLLSILPPYEQVIKEIKEKLKVR